MLTHWEMAAWRRHFLLLWPTANELHLVEVTNTLLRPNLFPPIINVLTSFSTNTIVKIVRLVEMKSNGAMVSSTWTCCPCASVDSVPLYVKMYVLLCAIVGTDVILSVSVEDEMINAEVRHAIMLAAQLGVPAHTLELWLARTPGRLVVGLPPHHPDYRGVVRGDTVVASKYFVNDNRLDPAARAAESFRYASPHSIHVLPHLPDRVAAPYVIRHSDKRPDCPLYLQLLVISLAFPLFVPHQEEKLISELKDDLLDAYSGFSSRFAKSWRAPWRLDDVPASALLKKGEANLASRYTPEALRMDFPRTLGYYLANAPLRDGVPVLV